jgi:hypothetical protein
VSARAKCLALARGRPGVPPRPRRYRQADPVSARVAATLAANQDVRTRLLSCDPDALTLVEALTVLLGERSLVPAARMRLLQEKLAYLACQIGPKLQFYTRTIGSTPGRAPRVAMTLESYLPQCQAVAVG